jgi:hypothetical protein
MEYEKNKLVAVIKNTTLWLFTYKRSFDVVLLRLSLFTIHSTILLGYTGRFDSLHNIESRTFHSPSIDSP